MKRLFLLGAMVCFAAACSAPQGKKIGVNNDGVAPVAAGPSENVSAINYNDRDATIALAPGATLTVTLPSYNRDGYEWRFSEIPDPSVLKMESKEYIPGADWRKAGEQKMVFRATGAGDVDVKMWYGTLLASPMESARSFHFMASVSEEVVPPGGKAKPAKPATKKTL